MTTWIAPASSSSAAAGGGASDAGGDTRGDAYAGSKAWFWTKASLVDVPVTALYAAITVAAACNAFMWMLDFSNPIIPSPASFVLGRVCIASGATLLAGLNFYPQAKRQWTRVVRAFADPGSSEPFKADAARFGACVVMKMVAESVAYWKALTSFTPCSQSLELSAYYGIAFVGHALFVGACAKVLGANVGDVEVIPDKVRQLIGGFDLVLAGLCACTSAFATRGFGVASAACGVAFFALAAYFTFEDKLPKPKSKAA
jgi:hypothetical protein